MRRIFISACLVCALLGYTAEAAGPGKEPRRIRTGNSSYAGSRYQGYSNHYNQGGENNQQMDKSSSDNSEMTIRGSVVNIDNLVASGRYNTSSSNMNSSYNNGYNSSQDNNSGSNSGNNGNNSYSDNNYSYYPPQPGVIGRAPGNNSPDINRAYQRETNVDIMRTYHRTYVPPVREGNTVNSGFDVRIPDNVVSPDGALRATRFNGSSTSEKARIENGKRQIAERTGRQIPSPYAASYNDRTGANENMAYNGLNENNESRYATLAPEVDNSVRNGNRQGANASMNQPQAAQPGNSNNNANAGSNNSSYQVSQNGAASSSATVGSTGSTNTKHKAYAHGTKSKAKSSAKSSHRVAHHKRSASKGKTASNRSSASQQPETNRVATLAPEQPQATNESRHDYGLMVGSGNNAQVYLVYDNYGRIASDRLRQYANREVTVRGSVKNVNGLNVIYLDQIQPSSR